MSGRVVHFELPYDDADRARRFYKEAFGWATDPVPQMDYTLVTTTETDESGPVRPGAVNGGMVPKSEVFTGPTVTIEVDDIEAALNTIRRLGGSLAVDRQPVGEMGYTAYFRDTEGNLVCLWQSA